MTQAQLAPENYPFDPENVPYLHEIFKVGGSRMAKNNSTQVWFVDVQEDDGTFTTHAGQLGGKITPKITKVKPKNVGRANETSAGEQAHLEAKAKWIRQVERKLYKRDLDDGMAPLYLPPMLAMDATKNPHRIDWVNRTYISQPKLNGVRFVAQLKIDGTVTLQSREGMYYTVQHIQDALAKIMKPGIPLDGELYLGEEYELGDVTGALKPGKPLHPLLKGCLFDLVHDTAIASKRYAALTAIMGANKSPSLELVPSSPVTSHEDMDAQHDKLATAGFEGIMIRDADGLYDYGYKGIAMFKYKKFQDEEFQIVDVEPDKDGTGGLFILKTDNRHLTGFKGAQDAPTVETFTCRNKGTNEMRADILTNPDKYVGKLLTVRFSEKLKTGVPEFNRGLTKDGMVAVRDYE